MIMAQLGAGVHQHRRQSAETPLQSWVAIDIDDIDGKAELAAQASQRGKHLLAQMAVATTI